MYIYIFNTYFMCVCVRVRACTYGMNVEVKEYIAGISFLFL